MRPRLDPELGVVASAKKDDDLYAKGGGNGKGQNGAWRAKNGPRIPPRKTFKRLGLLVLFAVAVYVFIHNIPTDLGPQDSKRHPSYANTHPGGSYQYTPSPPPPDAIPGDGRGAVVASRDFDGPVRFLELAETLHAISATKGQQQINKNVLFMASSIKSVNTLLPIACQMGRELRAYVHFVLISRNEVSLQQLRDINSIDDSCHILFHGKRSLRYCRLALFLTTIQMPAPSLRAFLQTTGSPSLFPERSSMSTTTCTRRPSWSTRKSKSLCFSQRSGGSQASWECRRPSSSYPRMQRNMSPG